MRDPRLPQQTKGAPVIRRFVMPLVALIVVAAILIASAPVEARSRMALGLWIPDGNRSAGAYKDFGDTIGRQPAIVTMSVQWGVKDRKWFPAGQARKARANGSAVMITWTPTTLPRAKETGKYARFKRIVKGKHDRYIKKFARQIKKYGGPVWMRPFHEVNATFFPWSKGWGKFYNPKTKKRDRKNDNNAKLYKKAWVRVFNLFQKVGAKNAKFVWTVAKQTCEGCNPYAKWEPPKGFKYAGFSNFNWGGYNGRQWNTFEDGLKQPMRNLKKITRKPIVIAELGTTNGVGPDDKDKDWWIRNGYPAVYGQYSNVVAVIYQHVNFSGSEVDHPNWALNDPPGSINAYRDLVKDSRFKGKVNKKGKVY